MRILLIWMLLIFLVAPYAAQAQWWNTSYLSSVYAGGLRSTVWGNDMAISDSALGAGSSGVTVLLPYWSGAMYQDGAITQVSMWVKTAGNGWRLKCYSSDWAGSPAFTYVSQSAAFNVASTGTQTVSVALADCPVASVLGVYVPHGAELWAKNTALVNTPWMAGDGTTWSTGGTVASKAIDLYVRGAPPFVTVAGDSIAAGHNVYYDPFESAPVTPLNLTSQAVYQAQQTIASTLIYQNYGVGSQACDYIDSIMTGTLAPQITKAFYLHCGTNDIGTGIGWSTGGATGNGTQGALNSILSKMPARSHLFLGNVIPRTGFSAATVDSFNANLATWAAAHSSQVTIVAYHDAMGTGAGLATPNPSLYGGDNVHPNVAGYTVMGRYLVTALRAVYGHNLFPLPNPGPIR